MSGGLEPGVVPAAITQLTHTSSDEWHMQSHDTHYKSHVTHEMSEVAQHTDGKTHLMMLAMQEVEGLHCSARMAAFKSRDSSALWLTCMRRAWGEEEGCSRTSRLLRTKSDEKEGAAAGGLPDMQRSISGMNSGFS